VWFLERAGEGLHAALKFSPFADPEHPMSRKVWRETLLLRVAERVELPAIVSQALPRLLHANEEDEPPLLITGFVEQPRVDRAAGRDFAASPPSALPWIEWALEFLRALHSATPLAEALGGSSADCVCHGDFSHYNAFGPAAGSMTILDWEDWALAAEGSRDLWHLAVLPTIAERAPAAAARSFREHWVDGSDYARRFFELAGGDLPEEGDQRAASMQTYLRGQIEQCAEAPSLRALFEACLAELEA
jgi:hypothetical protein